MTSPSEPALLGAVVAEVFSYVPDYLRLAVVEDANARGALAALVELAESGQEWEKIAQEKNGWIETWRSRAEEANERLDGMARAPYGEYDKMRVRAEKAEDGWQRAEQREQAAKSRAEEAEATLAIRDKELAESARLYESAFERAEEAERERDEALTALSGRTVSCSRCNETEARAAKLEAALRGLLSDDELCRYPPDGDTCFCSSCKRIREARAALLESAGRDEQEGAVK